MNRPTPKVIIRIPWENADCTALFNGPVLSVTLSPAPPKLEISTDGTSARPPLGKHSDAAEEAAIGVAKPAMARLSSARRWIDLISPSRKSIYATQDIWS